MSEDAESDVTPVDQGEREQGGLLNVTGEVELLSNLKNLIHVGMFNRGAVHSFVLFSARTQVSRQQLYLHHTVKCASMKALHD